MKEVQTFPNGELLLDKFASKAWSRKRLASR